MRLGTPALGSNARTASDAYNEPGRFKVKQMPKGTLSYGHDAVGNVTRISARSSYTFPFARPWAFVEAQLAANPSWASWAHMEYQHDSRNRFWKVFGAPGNGDLRGTYEYDAGGQVKTLVNGNGSLVTTYEYSSRGQLRHQKSLNGAVTHAAFDYDDFDTADGTFTVLQLKQPPTRPTGDLRLQACGREWLSGSSTAK